MDNEAVHVRHLTQRQLARRWDKAEATLERYRSEGTGPRYLKIGGKVLYRIEDVERFERDCLYDSPDMRASDSARGACA